METSSSESDVDVVRRYCDAWLAGDTLAVLSLYHEDLTLVWPGRHPFAGTHVGSQAAIEALLAVQELTNRVPVEIVDVLEGSSRSAAVVVERWTRETDGVPETLEHRRVLEYTVVDQKLHTCRVYESAQADVDEWLGGRG